MMIDTHCHINKNDYPNLDEVINRMKDDIIIVSGASSEANIEVVSLCKMYSNIYGTLGIHPEEIEKVEKRDFDFIEENMANPKIIGIGEIGLDYHFNSENKEQQKNFFIKQIEMANKYNKAIVVHSRDAILDTYNILKDTSKTKKVIHCFSSSNEMAKKFIEMGCMLGIGGIVTFKNGIKIKEVVKSTPIDCLLLETDSPWLSPEPFRGKQNEPYNILLVAQEISKIKEISLDDVLSITTKNAIKQFDLDINL